MLVKPFKLSIPQSDVADLQNRLKNARLPQMIEGTGWERGVPLAYLKKLVAHWNEAFDWRKQEARSNKVQTSHNRNRWSNLSLLPYPRPE